MFRETIATGGQNLVKGLNNLLDDIERGHGRLKISMTDPKAFELGVNIATTPGKVVFQNDLLQLIQYEPTTAKVAKRPLLVIPPWINKYYILDLREKNSFVKWATDQGYDRVRHLVGQPRREARAQGFRGLPHRRHARGAVDAIEKATGEKEVNAIGYCLGGTLLAATLAYMAAKKDRRIVSGTFMTSLVDFTRAGELEVFIDEDQVASLERKMSERGYLEGSEMANTFNMLRANDLIWSFVINNYLLGRDPFPFDLLHWNSDATRMPATMHSFYLRNMYMKNLLRVPGGITLAGVPIDLSKITVPTYFVSAIEDHIAPWKTTYAGPQLLSGQVAVRAVGLGPHRRDDQPAGRRKIRLLDQRQAAGDAGRMARRRQAARRFVVDPLERLARTAARCAGPRAHARQGQAQGARGGTGRLRPHSRRRQVSVSPGYSRELANPRRQTMTHHLSRAIAIAVSAISIWAGSSAMAQAPQNASPRGVRGLWPCPGRPLRRGKRQGFRRRGGRRWCCRRRAGSPDRRRARQHRRDHRRRGGRRLRRQQGRRKQEDQVVLDRDA